MLGWASLGDARGPLLQSSLMDSVLRTPAHNYFARFSVCAIFSSLQYSRPDTLIPLAMTDRNPIVTTDQNHTKTDE